MRQPLIEICVDHLDDVAVATNAGADRIELCGSLELGGVTPGPELLDHARALTAVPLMVMIRPRGGDFVYTADELASMAAAIERAKQCGADGLVMGCLTSDGDLDVASVSALVARARPLPVTFHRAFDEARDPLVVLDGLIELGVERLLTSGQAPTAPQGKGLIRDLVDRAAGRLTVMPGCGLRASNIREVADATGAVELHGSASTDGRTDADEIRAMRRALEIDAPPTC